VRLVGKSRVRVVGCGFDGLNRTRTERYAPSSDELTQVISAYDGNGNASRVEQHFASGVAITTAASYDAFDRRTAMIDRNGVTITQAFDRNHNRTERTGPEGPSKFTY